MVPTHVYAIVPARDEVVLDMPGVDKHTVHAVTNGDLAAVVSPTSLSDYRGLKREDAVHFLLAHQCVVDAVMRQSSVLPVKFGTVLRGEAKVRRLLTQGQNLFQATARKLADRVQIELVVTWDSQKVLQEIAREEPIAKLKAQMESRLDEQTTADRIALGQMVHSSIERRRAAVRERLLPDLQQCVLDTVVNPLLDESMVANLALLVDQGGRKALELRVEELDEQWEGKLTFRLVGPLPPYSFASVDVRTPSFDEVDRARKLLKLDEKATLDEIKRAYRALAAEAHPDHNPDSPEAEECMSELSKAHVLLTDYAESWALEEGNSHETACSFDRRSVENMLLISVRKQESHT